MISMIDSMDHLRVIDEAENGKELLLILEEKQPDLILMDLKMPVMDGMQASEYVKAHYDDVKIIVLSMYDDSKFIRHLVQLGINGYLLKNTDPDIIEATINKVMENGSYFQDRVNKSLQQDFLEDPEKPVFNTEFELNANELELMKYQLFFDLAFQFAPFFFALQAVAGDQHTDGQVQQGSQPEHVPRGVEYGMPRIRSGGVIDLREHGCGHDGNDRRSQPDRASLDERIGRSDGGQVVQNQYQPVFERHRMHAGQETHGQHENRNFTAQKA